MLPPHMLMGHLCEEARACASACLHFFKQCAVPSSRKPCKQHVPLAKLAVAQAHLIPG